MRDTWYVLEDGTPVHPSEVKPNDEGRLAHKLGLVAMREDGETPRSRGVDVDETAPKPAPAPAPVAPKTTTEMRPAPAPKLQAKKPGYKTRKAR